MAKVVYPGSFDPVTNGHLDIVRRSAALFDEVTVAVLVNESKVGMFSTDERLEMLRETTADMSNVDIDTFDGLLVDYCKRHSIDAIVKGLRAVSDFDYEVQMARMNKSMTGVDTIFIPASNEFSFLASSLIKEVAKNGGDVSAYLPALVNEKLRARTKG